METLTQSPKTQTQREICRGLNHIASQSILINIKNGINLSSGYLENRQQIEQEWQAFIIKLNSIVKKR
ncbi:MAG: hypothetical protein ACFFG0_09620 [Candidatus Thorarchaeota archaeon]